jgi:glucose/arabinose dehydrogenase
MRPNGASFVVWGFVLAICSTAGEGATLDPPQPVPDVATGFIASPLFLVAGPTALAFGPGDADGPDLYVATLAGEVVKISLLWTPAGPVGTGSSTFASGFTPVATLGIAFGFRGELYVSDTETNPDTGRTDGRVTRLDPGVSSQAGGFVILRGLPNGRHNTNHLRFGPDGRLYIANGNATDNGIEGGAPEVPPYSGSILAVDVSAVSQSPAILHWVDEQGQRIPERDIATASVNQDFNSKVEAVASGFRNVFGVAFSTSVFPPPARGIAYTAMNGADTPPSQDALFRISPGTDYGFPRCHNVGPPGGTGSAVGVQPNPRFVEGAAEDPAALAELEAFCASREPATALLGWHVCTTGLDFPTPGPFAFPEAFRRSVFVGECSAFFLDDLAAKAADDLRSDDPVRATHDTSHKVVRVALDESGRAIEVSDFLTGLVLATDVLFGPDGALYIADAWGVLRVAPSVPSSSQR